ncbi:hypothetical protein BD626DRAFT_519421, partial [Schizophyllum amplum]
CRTRQNPNFGQLSGHIPISVLEYFKAHDQQNHPARSSLRRSQELIATPSRGGAHYNTPMDLRSAPAPLDIHRTLAHRRPARSSSSARKDLTSTHEELLSIPKELPSTHENLTDRRPRVGAHLADARRSPHRGVREEPPLHPRGSHLHPSTRSSPSPARSSPSPARSSPPPTPATRSSATIARRTPLTPATRSSP